MRRRESLHWLVVWRRGRRGAGAAAAMPVIGFLHSVNRSVGTIVDAVRQSCAIRVMLRARIL